MGKIEIIPRINNTKKGNKPNKITTFQVVFAILATPMVLRSP